MRRVKIPKDATPPVDWLKEAQQVTADIHAAKDNKERNEIIEKNEKLWRDPRVRDWLLAIFNNKCWYTEAQDSVSAIHVDHYRPKGRVSDLSNNHRDGYWWMAFDWTNYRICGQLINVKKSDLFPLSDTIQATPDNKISIRQESPVLIDPITDDARLISYEMDEDACIAASAPGADDSEKERVAATIEILGLNRLDRLNQKRADVWNECRGTIAEYLSASTDAPSLKAIRQAIAIQSLQKLVAYKAEFSSVADACISKTANEIVRTKVYG